MKTSHDVINAPDYYSISGVLKEHLKWPLCLQKKTKKAYIKQAPSLIYAKRTYAVRYCAQKYKNFYANKNSSVLLL